MPHETDGAQFDFVIDQIYSQELQKPIKRLVIFLPGQVCHFWRMRKGDCCNNCAIPWSNVLALGKSVQDYDFSEIPVQFEAHRAMLDKAFESSNGVDTIVIFNGGSFLTSHEISETFRQYAMEQFASHPTAQQLLVEARPEHLKEADLRNYQRTIAPKKLKIAIGFESSDDFVRNDLHMKSMGKTNFERKVRMAKALGVQIQTYVFLKPAGLSEKDAIADVLQTCQYLQNLDVDEMALSCAFVPEGGKLQPLYEKGEFRPPWLWSILEIADRAQVNGWPLSIGGFDDFPPPIAVAHNCDRCSEPVKSALDTYRVSGKMIQSFETCGCKHEWREEVS